jgi:hypothetical protein
MEQMQVSASALIDAPSRVVYSILADYQEGHRQIAPKEYFVSFDVERGGVGAGTVIRFQMRSFGVTRTIRQEISEPEPGRVLAETDLATGSVTTFTVDPLEDGRRSSVTITTEWESRGFQGLMDRLFAPSFLRRVFTAELGNLARLASERVSSTEESR